MRIYSFLLVIIFACKPQGIEKQSSPQDALSEKRIQKTHTSTLTPSKTLKKVKLQDGIKITFFEEGKGEKIHDFDVLQINYEVYLENGTFVDGNKLLKRTWLPFIVGFEMQTKGWDLALKNLHVGDFVEIFLPSKMARGAIGIKGLIPPHSNNIIRLKVLAKIKPTRIIDGTKVWVLEENKSERKANLESTVDFHYMVSTPTKPKYDISYRKNLPYSLKFSDFGIVKGLKKALINAKKSDKLWVLIPPSQAYGARGLMDLVKPNEYVFYDLFVMDVR